MIYRLLRTDDFDACLPLLSRAEAIPAALLSSLPDVWRDLHQRGELHGGVVIDPGDPASGVLAFGMSVFVTETFITAELAFPRPHIGVRLYERISAGEHPLVRSREVAALNARGSLNLLILHFGLRQALDPSVAMAVVSTGQSGFRIGHGGYRAKRVLQEGYGLHTLPFFERGGFLLKSDYRDYYAENGGEPPDTARPFLAGLYAEDPESRHPGSALSDIFRAPVPRFFFSPAERRVLQHAVLDENDAQIAETLHISLDAVKKVWRGIYNRIAAVDPTLLNGGSEDDGVRGKEKRRALMRYLRYHLEELRPFKKP